MKTIIEFSREAEISYPRRRLEIHLRYAGPPVQTRYVARYICRHQEPRTALVEVV